MENGAEKFAPPTRGTLYFRVEAFFTFAGQLAPGVRLSQTDQTPVVVDVVVASRGGDKRVVLRAVVFQVQHQSILLSVDNHCAVLSYGIEVAAVRDLRPKGFDSGKVAETATSSLTSLLKRPVNVSEGSFAAFTRALTHDV